MSSFNKQNKPIFGNVLAIASVDAMTSLICGTTVFSVLGYIAKTQSKEIDDIIEQGPGLVFMVSIFFKFKQYFHLLLAFCCEVLGTNL
jgi:SNF family Na+-dependent transporter